MNRNRMLAIAAVALLMSLGITFFAYRILQQRTKPAEITTRIVVAAENLEIGQRITAADIRMVEWPKATPLEGSFSDIESVVGRGTMLSFQKNEPILESRLAPKEAGVGLMAMIPEGMRALSIQVNSIIGVSGFVVPGSRVDLILTAVPPSGVKGARGEEMGSKIILENLEVMAAGQNVQRDVDGKPQTVQDVTLLLTPDQAQRVALATGDGRIQLALRSPLDNEAAEPALVVRSRLYEGPTMEQPGGRPAVQPTPETTPAAAPKRAAVPAKTAPPPAAAPTGPRTVVVEIIQGVKRSSAAYEDPSPESNGNSTQTDGTTQ